MKDLIEDTDWYRDVETGDFVWTSKYLLDQGFCCNGGCRHCPYDENGDLKSFVESICIYDSKERSANESDTAVRDLTPESIIGEV